jgi:hypothetical protein
MPSLSSSVKVPTVRRAEHLFALICLLERGDDEVGS